VGRDRRGGPASEATPGRGGSLDAHRALNDCDTVPRRLSTSQNFIHSSKLVISSRSLGRETTTFLPVREVFEKGTGNRQ